MPDNTRLQYNDDSRPVPASSNGYDNILFYELCDESSSPQVSQFEKFKRTYSNFRSRMQENPGIIDEYDDPYPACVNAALVKLNAVRKLLPFKVNEMWEME